MFCLQNIRFISGAKSPASKFDPIVFISQSIKLYPAGALSLGWTTTNNAVTNYTWSNMFGAYNLLKKLNLLDSKTEITFGK